MIGFRKSGPILIAISLCGCATKYQPTGFTGGYEDTHIK